VNGSAISLGGSATVTAVNPNALTLGSGLSGTSFNGSAAVTAAVDSTIPRLAGGNTFTEAQTVTGSVTSARLLVLNAPSGQSVNIQEWQTNGSLQAAIGIGGQISTTQRGTFGSQFPNTIAQLAVLNPVATRVGLAVQGAASQSSNLTEWQNSASSIIFAIRSDGKPKWSSNNSATTVGTTGTASALPALPVGYAQIEIGGTIYKFPYYNN
jgi:hypothetical protein